MDKKVDNLYKLFTSSNTDFLSLSSKDLDDFVSKNRPILSKKAINKNQSPKKESKTVLSKKEKLFESKRRKRESNDAIAIVSLSLSDGYLPGFVRFLTGTFYEWVCAISMNEFTVLKKPLVQTRELDTPLRNEITQSLRKDHTLAPIAVVLNKLSSHPYYPSSPSSSSSSSPSPSKKIDTTGKVSFNQLSSRNNSRLNEYLDNGKTSNRNWRNDKEVTDRRVIKKQKLHMNDLIIKDENKKKYGDEDDNDNEEEDDDDDDEDDDYEEEEEEEKKDNVEKSDDSIDITNQTTNQVSSIGDQQNDLNPVELVVYKNIAIATGEPSVRRYIDLYCSETKEMKTDQVITLQLVTCVFHVLQASLKDRSRMSTSVKEAMDRMSENLAWYMDTSKGTILNESTERILKRIHQRTLLHRFEQPRTRELPPFIKLIRDQPLCSFDNDYANDLIHRIIIPPPGPTRLIKSNYDLFINTFNGIARAQLDKTEGNYWGFEHFMKAYHSIHKLIRTIQTHIRNDELGKGQRRSPPLIFMNKYDKKNTWISTSTQTKQRWLMTLKSIAYNFRRMKNDRIQLFEKKEIEKIDPRVNAWISLNEITWKYNLPLSEFIMIHSNNMNQSLDSPEFEVIKPYDELMNEIDEVRESCRLVSRRGVAMSILYASNPDIITDELLTEWDDLNKTRRKMVQIPNTTSSDKGRIRDGLTITGYIHPSQVIRTTETRLWKTAIPMARLSIHIQLFFHYLSSLYSKHYIDDILIQQRRALRITDTTGFQPYSNMGTVNFMKDIKMLTLSIRNEVLDPLEKSIIEIKEDDENDDDDVKTNETKKIKFRIMRKKVRKLLSDFKRQISPQSKLLSEFEYRNLLFQFLYGMLLSDKRILCQDLLDTILMIKRVFSHLASNDFESAYLSDIEGSGINAMKKTLAFDAQTATNDKLNILHDLAWKGRYSMSIQKWSGILVNHRSLPTGLLGLFYSCTKASWYGSLVQPPKRTRYSNLMEQVVVFSMKRRSSIINAVTSVLLSSQFNVE
jgi:hypothetical protein